MSRDILDEFDQQRGQPEYPLIAARVGEIVEDRASGFCGDIVTITAEAVTLRDRRGRTREFRYKPGGFLLEAAPPRYPRRPPRCRVQRGTDHASGGRPRCVGDRPPIRRRVGRHPPAGDESRRVAERRALS